MSDNPIFEILQDAIPSTPLYSPEFKAAPHLTAESLRAAIRKLDEVFYPPPCGSEERPHLIHPRDWAEGNVWMCANLCGQMVDPRRSPGGMAPMTTLTDPAIEAPPRTLPAEPGDHERFSHFVESGKLDVALIEGTPVVALCGKVWVPFRDPKRFPVCPECKDIYDGLGDDEPDEPQA